MKPLGLRLTRFGSTQRKSPPSTLERQTLFLLRSLQKHSRSRSILCDTVGMISSPKLALSASEPREESTLSAGLRWSRLISWVRRRLARALAVLKMVSQDQRFPMTNTRRKTTHISKSSMLSNNKDPAESHHFWLELTLDHMFEVTSFDYVRRLPLLSVLCRSILATMTAYVRRKHIAHSRAS